MQITGNPGLVVTCLFALLAGGLFCIGKALQWEWRTARRARNGCVVDGKVVRLVSREDSPDEPSFVTIVEFRDGRGESHQIQSKWAQSPAPYQVGQVVKVSYEAGNPRDGDIVNRSLGVALGVLGVVLALTAAILLTDIVKYGMKPQSGKGAKWEGREVARDQPVDRQRNSSRDELSAKRSIELVPEQVGRYPPERVSLIGLKEERLLEVWVHGARLETAPVVSGARGERRTGPQAPRGRPSGAGRPLPPDRVQPEQQLPSLDSSRLPEPGRSCGCCHRRPYAARRRHLHPRQGGLDRVPRHRGSADHSG
jgi:hypothetical protein